MYLWLVRLYSRRGARYPQICAGLAIAELMGVLTPVSTLVTGRYMGLSVREWIVSFAVAEPCLVLSVLAARIAARREYRLVRLWCAGVRDGLDHTEVAEAARVLPTKLFVVTAACAFATALPLGVLTTLEQIHRVRFGDFLLLLLAGFLFSLWGIVWLWQFRELALRPIIAGIGVDVVAVPGRARLSGLAVKLSVALGSAFLVGSVYGGALSADAGTAFEGLLRLIEVTLIVCGGFGLFLVPVMSPALLEPIRSLTQATRRVGRGDLSGRVPVITGDEIGVLAASFNDMLLGLRERTELRADNARLVADLQASRERLVNAAVAVRRRVERDLHDGAQQQLVVVRVAARKIRAELAAESRDTSGIEQLEKHVVRAIEELRDLAHGVYPAQLDAEGLASALADVAARATIACEVRCAGLPRSRGEVEAAVYFSCTEALHNAEKYAGDGARVCIELVADGPALAFRVSDDGAGFEVGRLRPTSGLQNIVDRVGAVGGEVDVRSAPGRGTEIRGRIPNARATV